MLSITALGTLAFTIDNEQLSGFRSAKIQALLLYLAMEIEWPHRREFLMDLLWPDSDSQQARANLRQSLYQLRKVIGDQETAVPTLLVTRETIQLNPNADITFDVNQFTQAVDTRDFETAASLYAGDLATGFSCESSTYDDWIGRKREKLHRQALDLFFQLGEQSLAQGADAISRAQAFAQRQLTLEPWREEAHRQLMMAYALAGDRAAAVRQFDICADILADELGVSPAPETFSLFESIRDEQWVFEPGRFPVKVPEPPTNLPQTLTPFFGRERELTQIREILATRRYRLLTLTGQGGIGKSRLALEAARLQKENFKDGIWIVPLAGIDATEDVLPTIANALNIQLVGEQPIAQQLQSRLRQSEMLLLLDNLEQLPEEVADVIADLLKGTKSLMLIATSRRRLYLRIETILPLDGLPVPAKNEANPETFTAVSFFIDQMQRVNPNHQPQVQLIREICALLGGLPLGIELAAAQTERCSLNELATVLRASLDSVETRLRDVPARQRSLQAVFDSSWTLLPPAQQKILAQISIFRGTFSLDDAQAVVDNISAGILNTLINQSLLQKSFDRYRLHEVIREFAAAKRRQNPAFETIAAKHSQHFLQVVRDLEPLWYSEKFADAVQRSRRSWENINAAWQLARKSQDLDLLEKTVSSMRALYRFRGYYANGAALFDAMYEQLSQDGIEGKRPLLLGWALAAKAWFLVQLRRHEEAETTLKLGLEFAQQIDNLPLMLDLQISQQISLTQQDDYTGSLALAEEIIDQAAKIDSPLITAQANLDAGFVKLYSGDFAGGRDLFIQAETVFRNENDGPGLITALRNLGLAQSLLGEFETAEQHLSEALTLARQRQDREREIFVISILGIHYLHTGDYGQAVEMFQEQLTFERTLGLEANIASCLVNLSSTLSYLGNYQLATSYLTECLGIIHRVESQGNVSIALQSMGSLYFCQGMLEKAADFLWQAITTAQEHHLSYPEANARSLLGQVYFAQSQPDLAIKEFEQSLELQQELGDKIGSKKSHGELARVYATLGEFEAARHHVESVLSDEKWQLMSNPHLTLFACYQALETLQDPRAQEIGRRAKAILQERANRISNSTYRHSFLHNVPFNQTILDAFPD